MDSKEFKTTFKKYRMGTLTNEEEERLEDELEKLDEYQAFIEAETKDENDFTSETERKILRRSQLAANFRMGLISLVIALLLLPTLNLVAMALDIIP